MTRPSIYLYLLVSVTWAGVLILWVRYSNAFNYSNLLPSLVFLVIAMLCEAYPISLPRGGGTVSVGFVVTYAAVLIFGPTHGAIVAALGSLSLKELKGKLLSVLFNRGQLALSALVSGGVLSYFGGIPGAYQLPLDVPRMLIAGIVYELINLVASMLYIALDRKLSLSRVWEGQFAWLATTYLVFIPFGVIIAVVYPVSGWLGLVLFVFPLIVARYAFQRYIDMKKLYVSTVKSLARAIEAKDSYTFGHSERVAKYAVQIAKKLQLPERKIELLEYASLLHDIGKIGVRDEVLHKAGLLTAAEHREMMTHTILGAHIVGEIEALREGVDWILHHHERYDGTGYPDGLRGQEISLEARILAVADAFDAMTSARPHKAPFTVEKAREELKRMSGSQFDPVVVNAFVDGKFKRL